MLTAVPVLLNISLTFLPTAAHHTMLGSDVDRGRRDPGGRCDPSTSALASARASAAAVLLGTSLLLRRVGDDDGRAEARAGPAPRSGATLRDSLPPRSRFGDDDGRGRGLGCAAFTGLAADGNGLSS